MKTSELTGALLDLWVAKAEGLDPYQMLGAKYEPEGWAIDDDEVPGDRLFIGSLDADDPRYAPSTDWAVGGPIIQRDQIFLQPPSEVHYNGGPNHGWKRYDHWRATVSARTRTLPPKNDFQEEFKVRGVGRGAGETPLLAAMRAKVASHYGDEVPDSHEAALDSAK